MTLVETQPQVPARPLSKLFDPYDEIAKNAKPRWQTAMWVGYFFVFMFFGGFGGFAALAPLQSSIKATGSLRIDNERKVVQHRHGGIVADIRVREGQRVEEGEVLLTLDPTEDRARLDATRKQHWAALAERARLVAERDELEAIRFPSEITENLHVPDVAEIVANERYQFDTRRQSRDGQTQLMLGQIDQSDTILGAYELERDSVIEQIDLVARELTAVRELYEKGLERLPRLLALERHQAGLKGRLGRLDGDIARTKQQISDTELRIIQFERGFQEQVAARLDAVVHRIQQLNEQLPVVDDKVRRLEVRAPRTGRIIDMAVFTVGGVVAPGQVLMEIVPEDEELVVVADISPRDIENLNSGITKIQIRMTSFSQRFTHPINGELLSVSQDTVENPRTGKSSYKAIIRLDPASKELILPGIELVSGMPAMAMIGVGERTLLTYLTDPIIRSISMSLHEP